MMLQTRGTCLSRPAGRGNTSTPRHETTNSIVRQCKIHRRELVIVRVSEDEAVQRVLARDSAEASEVTSTRSKSVLKSKNQRRQELAESRGKPRQAGEDSNRPKRARDAIQKGLELFRAGSYAEAISMFSLSLELPGNGAYRLAGSPREFSCPSDAEENAALYNLACCYARLGQVDSGITCLEAVLENGFEEFATIRSDPDLAPLRGGKLDQLLSQYDGPVSMLKKVFQRPDPNKSDTNKPWLLW